MEKIVILRQKRTCIWYRLSHSFIKSTKFPDYISSGTCLGGNNDVWNESRRGIAQDILFHCAYLLVPKYLSLSSAWSVISKARTDNTEELWRETFLNYFYSSQKPNTAIKSAQVRLFHQSFNYCLLYVSSVVTISVITPNQLLECSCLYESCSWHYPVSTQSPISCLNAAYHVRSTTSYF